MKFILIKHSLFIGTCIVGILTSGCGQKGSLYLPAERPIQNTTLPNASMNNTSTPRAPGSAAQ